MSKRKKRLPELNVLSGIAIICVVLIHSNAGYLLSILGLKDYTDAGFTVRLLDNFIHGAVPLFIFISGYKYALNNTGDAYKTYLVKKLSRVLRPFILISMIFLIRDIIRHTDEYSSPGRIGIQLVKIFTGNDNPAYHLWYIPMYLFISLTYPFIHQAVKNEKLRIAVILLISFIHRILGLKYDFMSERPFNYGYYFLFFEMGVLFYKYNIKDKMNKRGTLFVFLYVVGAIVLTINPVPALYEIIQAYVLWPLGITAYYLVSVQLCDNKMLNYLGTYSFYIYILHEPIILSKIFWLINSLGLYHSQIWVYVIVFLTLVFTMILYKLIDRTPIKRILFGQ